MMKSKQQILIHTIIWLTLLMSPFAFFKFKDTLNWAFFARHLTMTITMITIFYANFGYLTKRFFNKENMKKFLFYDLLFIVFFCGVNFLCRSIVDPYIQKGREERILQEHKEIGEYIKDAHYDETEKQLKITPHSSPQRTIVNLWELILNVFAFVCMIGTAIAAHSTRELYLSEEKRKEEEKIKVEAELKNLKSQLNPHFLFNTLNNIYALIAISQDKSQQAVMELSKLLRYVLYEAEQEEVPLHKETDFIANYVELMKLRLSGNTKLNINMETCKESNVMVAPLLLITLIENAFKHGISYQNPSFINFSVEVKEDDVVVCHLENSYFPKTDAQDKSGSGIGIENLKRRLSLIYPDRHSYTINVEDNTYKSTIIINTKKDNQS